MSENSDMKEMGFEWKREEAPKPTQPPEWAMKAADKIFASNQTIQKEWATRELQKRFEPLILAAEDAVKNTGKAGVISALAAALEQAKR